MSHQFFESLEQHSHLSVASLLDGILYLEVDRADSVGVGVWPSVNNTNDLLIVGLVDTNETGKTQVVGFVERTPGEVKEVRIVGVGEVDTSKIAYDITVPVRTTTTRPAGGEVAIQEIALASAQPTAEHKALSARLFA